MIREIGRILVSLALVALACFLFCWGFQSPQTATALSTGSIAGAIVGSLLTYWLKA